MNQEKEKSIEKKCAESCGCDDVKDAKKDEDFKEPLTPTLSLKERGNVADLDPTHFGDWQVNCRAIDF
jgi:hypothetical protein